MVFPAAAQKGHLNGPTIPSPFHILACENSSVQEHPNEEVDLGQRGVVPIIIPDFGIGRDVKIC